MRVDELTDDVREVLFGLLAHLVDADARLSSGESRELAALGEELGVGPLDEALARARRAFPTADDAVAAAARITDEDARELVRTLLIDLMAADGERTPDEEDLIYRVAAAWNR
jgi:uncharacterized tellurite resistance protein B-like protein